MKNFRALNVLKSWLRANQIPFSGAKDDADLVVSGKTGDVPVRVLAENASQLDGAIDIVATDLMHRNRDVALKSYHVLTEAAGFGSPMPFDRGEEPEQKPLSTDDEFLVGIRHTEVRRSPNPDPAKFAEYDKVLHKAVWTFYNVNRDFCRRIGYSVEDLMSYAQTMLISFCARTEDESLPRSENEKTLYVYLRQRFAEIYKIMTQKDRSMTPDADTVSIALLNKSYRADMNLGFEYENDPRDVEGDELMVRMLGSKGSEPSDAEYRNRKRQLDCSSPTKRKSSASKMLRARLEAMPHDDMVELLTTSTKNILIAPDARREAGKQLKKHNAACTICKPLEIEIDEESGEESLGAEE